MAKKIKTTKQSSTGLNQRFKDPATGIEMSRGEFADKIEAGKYSDYHIAHMKSGNQTIRVPKSNPDGKKGNNLG